MTSFLLEVFFEFLLAPLLMPVAMPFILIAAIFSRQGYWATVKRYTRATWEWLKRDSLLGVVESATRGRRGKDRAITEGSESSSSPT